MKAIFLDIDGVLNNQEHLLLLHNRFLGREQYLQLLQGLHETPLDYRSCILLQKLLYETSAEVILSSTWRLSEKHIEGIRKYGGIEIKDITPRLDTIRGEEIQAYSDKHPEIENYVILDDDSDMLPEQICHFVKCDSKIGFTDKEYEKCWEILKRRRIRNE